MGVDSSAALARTRFRPTRALSAHSAQIGGNVFLRSGFYCRGETSFTGARISGNLECNRGEFQGELNLETSSIRGALFFKDVAKPDGMRLNLANATVDSVVDEQASWPSRGNLLLDGFTYDHFAGGAPRDLKARLDWLARQQYFMIQPYRQLAATLRGEGAPVSAQKILFAMEDGRRKLEDRNWFSRAASCVYRNTLGYGYSPTWPAVRCLLAITVLGAIIFARGYASGSMVPSDRDAYIQFTANRKLPPAYEAFQPMMYSVETSFQLVKIGQADRWEPDPAAGPVRQGCRGFLTTAAEAISSTRFVRFWRWAQIILGWLFSAVVVAGLTGFVRKD